MYFLSGVFTMQFSEDGLVETMYGLAFSLAAQLQAQDKRGFRMPAPDVLEGRWAEFSGRLHDGLKFEEIEQRGDQLERLFLLSALCSDPTLCQIRPPETLDGHIINRLFESLFGEDAPPPISLVFFFLDSAWEYLCEPSSIDSVVGSARLLHGAMSLGKPLEHLAKHCHLRAAATVSFLSAARLVNDCMICNTCDMGLVLTPSSASGPLSEAVARFVAVATLSAPAQCFVLDVYPIEIAFGFGTRDRWFQDFAENAARIGSAGLAKLGFSIDNGIEDSASLFEGFFAKKSFAELIDFGIFNHRMADCGPQVPNRYDAEAFLENCQECARRPASFALQDGRLICEPCQWRASVGARLIEESPGLEDGAWLRGGNGLAVLFVECDPFALALEEGSSLSKSLKLLEGLQNSIASGLADFKGAFGKRCLIAALSPTESLIFVRRYDCDSAKKELERFLKRRLPENVGSDGFPIRICASTGEHALPVNLLVRDAVTIAIADAGAVPA
ncbi:hypothetical protein J7M28_09205 [bacterium]|nr:hypothetical protein [bacterium]